MSDLAKIHRATGDTPDECGWMIQCPACGCGHLFRDTWTFNGDIAKPTFSPSMRVRSTVPITDEEHAKIMRGEPFEPKPLVCHSFVKNGNIEFLGDCTHELAGKTVPLEDW